VVGSDGVRLAVRTFPGPSTDAPTVVLHHGLASSQHIWDLMLPALSRTFRVVTFDARGHGRSAKPDSGYGFDHTVADTMAVLRATRARRPLLIGHSWGAMVALELAARHPRALSGVVLVDGGITRDNIGTLRGTGVDIVVTGSAVYDGKAPAENARAMLASLRGA